MKKTINKKITKGISLLLILLILIGLVGIIVKFTNGLTTNFKTLYLNIDGKDIISKGEGYTILSNEELKVNVKYTFNNSTSRGYKIKVVPNIDEYNDLDFSLNEDVYSFKAEKDLTKGFNIEKTQDYFIIKPKGNIQGILSNVYHEYEVKVSPTDIYPNMFSLVVLSLDGKVQTILNFMVDEKVYGVTLDKEVIVF